MPSLTLDIKFGSDIHKKILHEVQDRIKASKRALGGRHEKWIKNEEAALAYITESEIDAQRRLQREQSGKQNYTTIQIPYSYAVLMASHTYWTTVFMSRDPVLQFAGRHGESQQQVQALEALMAYQVQVGEMLVPLYIWLMDVGKYGAGVIGDFWDEDFSIVSEVVEREEMFLGLVPTGKMKKSKVSRRVRGYTGNKLYNVRPYDFFSDPRVTLSNFQKGEFCGVYNEISWNTVLRREDRGLYTNTEELRKSRSVAHSASGERVAGSTQIELPGANDFDTGSEDRKRPEHVALYECYIDLVPSAWKLGKSSMPEKWVFTVSADFKVVVGAQPLGANHNKFPFGVLEFEPEGYAIAGRGIPEILDPVQRTMDWLINSHFYNVRKVMNDQFVVDPSRVVMKDLLDPLPGNLIRLKPAAYGTDPRLAIHQLQVVDVTQNHLRDLQLMLDIGQRTLGVSDQILGAIQQGGRKTATEVRTASTFGINRLKTSSEFFSAQGWTPLTQMMVANSQQYYDDELKFRIVGDLIVDAGQEFIQVNPDDISGFYDFVPVDGTLPIDRLAQANLWRELMAQLRNFPEILATYDMSRIFAWVAKLSGLKNIEQFKIQVAPDAQLARQAEAGNVVPLGGQAPAASGPRDLTRVPSGQIGQIGGTA